MLALTILHFGALASLLLSGRWIRSLGGSESELGWFSASIVPGIVLGAPLAGRLARRYGEKPLILLGLFLVGAMTFGFTGIDQLTPWLALMRFFQGLGHGMVFTCLLSLAAQHIADDKKAQGMGYVALCAQLGNVSGVILAEGLLPFGFIAVFIGGGTLACLAWLGTLGLPAETPYSKAEHTGNPAGFAPGTRQIALAVAFFLTLGGSYGTVLQLIPLLVLDIARLTGESARATPVMAAIFVTVAICRFALASLADGRHRQSVLIASTVLLIAATLCWPLASSIKQMMIVAVFFAFGYGLLFPGLNGLVLSQVAPAWRSRASGWIVMAFDGGFFGLLLALGPIAQRFGYLPMFALLALMQLSTALLFLGMLRRLGAKRR